MGKHERWWVEKAEKDVTNGLNGVEQSSEISSIVQSIQEKVGTDYNQAVWVGGSNYDDPGDVHICWPDKKKKIELKFSHKSGSGTTKNIGQGFFTKKIDNSIIGYQEWDLCQGFKEKRYSLLEEHIGRKLNTTKDYCQQLRKFRDLGDPIIELISKITGPGQESYAQYAAQMLNQHLDKVNSVVQEILNVSGADKKHQDVLYCVIKNFESKKQTIEFFDFTDFDKTITKIENVGKTIKFLNASGKDVLRFSVTWKNICQGGATPCFNVFIGNAYNQ